MRNESIGAVPQKLAGLDPQAWAEFMMELKRLCAFLGNEASGFYVGIPAALLPPMLGY